MQIFGIIGGFLSSIYFYITLLATKLTLKILAFTIVSGLVLTAFAQLAQELETLERIFPAEVLILWGHLAPPNALQCLTVIVVSRISLYVVDWIASFIFKVTE